MFKKLSMFVVLVALVLLAGVIPAAAQAPVACVLDAPLLAEYGMGDQDGHAIELARQWLCGAQTQLDESRLALLTEARDDQFSLVLGTAGVSLSDAAGIGNFTVPAGPSWVWVSPMPNGAVARGEALTGSQTGTVMLSLSAEPSVANIAVTVKAVMPDGSLVDVVSGSTTRDATEQIGRLNGVIHHALWQQELDTNVPIGYIVAFNNPTASPAMFRLDHNPLRGSVSVANIAPWTPGS